MNRRKLGNKETEEKKRKVGVDGGGPEGIKNDKKVDKARKGRGEGRKTEEKKEMEEEGGSGAAGRGGTHLVEGLHQPLVVGDVLHLVQEPAVDLGQLVQLVHCVAVAQRSRQDENTLVRRHLQLLGNSSGQRRLGGGRSQVGQGGGPGGQSSRQKDSTINSEHVELELN